MPDLTRTYMVHGLLFFFLHVVLLLSISHHSRHLHHMRKRTLLGTQSVPALRAVLYGIGTRDTQVCC